jgi:hypothetical protein
MKIPLILSLYLCFSIGLGAHAQEMHLIGPNSVQQHPVSPQVIEDRIASAAIQYQAYRPIPRIALFDIAFPANAEEYRSLSGYGVVVVSAVTQAVDELPPSRVFVRVGERDVDSSCSVPYDQTLRQTTPPPKSLVFITGTASICSRSIFACKARHS